MALNIKQITNYDITEDMPVELKLIPLPSLIEDAEGQLSVNQVEKDIEYIEILNNVEIIKLGYICEPKGHIYPIYLKMNDNYEQIWLSPNGIYEMQPETYTEEENEFTSDVIIQGVKIPKGIEFKLDYIINIPII